MEKRDASMNNISVRNFSALSMFFLGIIIFMSGYHAVDLSWNMKYVESICDIKLIDTSFGGFTSDSVNMYRQGMILIFMGLYMTLVSVAMFQSIMLKNNRKKK